jgi:hypothetical protein
MTPIKLTSVASKGQHAEKRTKKRFEVLNKSST